MKRGPILFLAATALFAEALLPSVSPVLPPAAPFALHALLVAGGVLLLRRAPAGGRALAALVVVAGVVFSLIEAGAGLAVPSAPSGPEAQKIALETDATLLRSAFDELLSREKTFLDSLPRAAVTEGSSREELFARLSALVESGAAGGGAGAITLYTAKGQPLAWAGEASVLDAGVFSALEEGKIARIVRRDLLATRLYTVRALGGAKPRYAVSELLLDAPYEPEAWRRVLVVPPRVRSSVSAEFLESGQADASLREFLREGGDRYWTKGHGSTAELMSALRDADGELLGILTLRPAPASDPRADRALLAATPRTTALGAAFLSLLFLAIASARREDAPAWWAAGVGVLIVGLRLFGAALPPLFPGAPIFDYRLFSLPAFSGLAGSPGEALFTALAVLAGAALLCRAAQGQRAWARIGSFALAAGFVAALAWLTPSWVANCALNLARSPFLAPRAARLSLYSAHAALALAAALLALRAFTPRSRPLGTRAIAFAWLAATAFSFLLLARGAMRVPTALVETSLAPEVVQSAADARAGLLSLLEDVAHDPRWEALESGNADTIEQLAFDAWRSSDLGGNGMRSAVAALGADGSVRASFAYGLPESVFRDTPPLRPPAPAAGGAAPPDGPVLGEQHYTVVSLDVPLLRGDIAIVHDGRRVGSFSAIVSGERDNIPFLTLSDPLLRTLGAGRAEPLFEEYFGGAPLFLAWSPSGEVLFPSAERASPLPSGSLPLLHATWTRTRYAGESYHIYRFPTPDGPRAIGYAARGRTFLAAGLVRALLAGLPLLLLALLVPALLRPPARAPFPERARWTSILTGSYYRRLLAVVLLSSLVPLLLLAAIFRGSIERRTREEFERDGVQAAGTVRRLLEDYVTSRAPAAGAPSPIESWTLFWLGRTIHEDIDLFAGETLAATSRGSLEASGLRSFRLNAEVARALALNRPPQFLSKEPRPGHAETIVYAPVRLRAGSPDGILAVPLILEERGLGRAGEEIADAILSATFGLGLALLGVGYVFTRRLSVPIRELGSASRRIAEGNLDVRVRPRGRDEIRQLVDAFNGMAIALGTQREDLRRRKEYIEAILLNVTTGVISTDANGVVRTANPAASILLGLPADLEGRSLFAELGERAELAPVLALWSGRPGGAPTAAPREIPLRRGGEEIRLRSVVLPLAEPDGASEGRIYLVEDVTEVMRSNRLAAWAEMARRIAHEIKNPLTPIQLSAEHLLRVRSDRNADYDRVLRECVETILGQVRALREISSDFSAYSRLPDLRREPTDLAALLRGTLAPYRSAPPAGIRFEEDLEPIEPFPLDGRVLRRAFVNLLENALQAMEEGGTLRVTLRRRGEGADAVAEVEVADTGEGIEEEAIARIFEPYFSTRDAGVGLGLAIARRAVEEHGGTITAESTAGRGTRMIVRLPLTPLPR